MPARTLDVYNVFNNQAKATEGIKARNLNYFPVQGKL